MKEYVTNLELSKQLKKVGVTQKSKFYWLIDTHWNKYNVSLQNKILHKKQKYYSAFLSDELLNMLPDRLQVQSFSDKEWAYLNIRKYKNRENKIQYVVEYSGASSYAIQPQENDSSLVNTLALMVIHLLKNKLIEVK